MEEYNKCCICNSECNPSSQTCGMCAHDLTGYALGWNTSEHIREYLSNWAIDSDPVKEESTVKPKIVKRKK